MNEFPRLKAAVVTVCAITIMALVVSLIVVIWRAGWFDEPSSTERYAREARRAARRNAFSVAAIILIYAGAGVLIVAAGLALLFLRSKVVNANTLVYAQGGMYPIVKQRHRVQIMDQDGRRAIFSRLQLFDPNRALAPVTELGPDGASFQAHDDDMPATQMAVTLGALTVQRQAAASHDPGLNLIDDDVATPDVVDHGPMPNVELDTAGHIQTLIQESGVIGGDGE